MRGYLLMADQKNRLVYARMGDSRNVFIFLDFHLFIVFRPVKLVIANLKEILRSKKV